MDGWWWWWWWWRWHTRRHSRHVDTHTLREGRDILCLVTLLLFTSFVQPKEAVQQIEERMIRCKREAEERERQSLSSSRLKEMIFFSIPLLCKITQRRGEREKVNESFGEGVEGWVRQGRRNVILSIKWATRDRCKNLPSFFLSVDILRDDL